MKNYYLFIFLIITLLLSSLLKADADNDQWLDTEKTYSSLIDEGYEVKAYDITNFYDQSGNLYMFFVTVLQKFKKVYECQEYQVFDNSMITLDLTFVCRELVEPYKRGLGI
tara:strand:+ start:2941 stop:3273 length:333 start_codon:yes stop_codon:yes gene_type:complete